MARLQVIIIWQLALFDPQKKLGRAWIDTGFRVSPGFRPAPDFAYIMTANLPPDTTNAVPVRPELAVEVWSPGDLDTKAHQAEARSKIRLYQVAGVNFVWAINPSTQKVEIYHPGQVSPIQILGIDDELSGEEVIPGFTMPVRALFD